MEYNQFIQEVKTRAHLDNEAQALNAIESTLNTLAERILKTEADDLAAQLPREIGAYLIAGEYARRFDLEDFYYKVSLRESVGQPLAMMHARAVLSVVEQAVSPGELRDVLAELPEEDYLSLFTYGSEYRNLEGK